MRARDRDTYGEKQTTRDRLACCCVTGRLRGNAALAKVPCCSLKSCRHHWKVSGEKERRSGSRSGICKQTTFPVRRWNERRAPRAPAPARSAVSADAAGATGAVCPAGFCPAQWTGESQLGGLRRLTVKSLDAAGVWHWPRRRCVRRDAAGRPLSLKVKPPPFPAHAAGAGCLLSLRKQRAALVHTTAAGVNIFTLLSHQWDTAAW